jgi:hypothetical protein
VGQHGLADDVADGEDVRDVGAHLFVDGNEAALVDGDAGCAGTDAAQKGSANLEALAPILDPNPLYPPGTKIFSGDVQFTVVIRETGPKPAEAGATP